MKMIFPWTLKCLIATHLISLAIYTAGDLVMSRDFVTNEKGRQARLTCTTDDDLGLIVWKRYGHNVKKNCANDCCTFQWRLGKSKWNRVDRSISTWDNRLTDSHCVYTKHKNAKLRTKEIPLTANNFCIEVQVYLCLQCELVVELIDSDNNSTYVSPTRIRPEESTQVNVLMWKIVEWKLNDTENFSTAALRFTTKLPGKAKTEPRWAIGSFRECRNAGTRRACSFDDDTKKWSESKDKNISCQKLSYTTDDDSVVKWIDPSDSDKISSNLRKCLEGNKSGICELKCSESCKGTFICDSTGCICGPGFTGSDCEDQKHVGSDPEKTSKVGLSAVEWFFIVFIPVAFSIFPIITYRTGNKCFGILAWILAKRRRPTPEQSFTPSQILVNETNLSEISAVTETAQWNRQSGSIPIEDFEEYVKNSIISGLLSSQFAMFPKGLNKPCEFGAQPVNAVKNRYKSILPYDETRVILATDENNCRSDYINANYIEGLQKPKTYIATQGPKRETLNDFWRMVWEENSTLICMLTDIYENGKKKCEQYWPKIGTSHKYGNIVVMTTDQQIFADYTYRSFLVNCDQQVPRKIEHLHYKAWRDHMIPPYMHSIIAYLKRMLRKETEGPVIVHCCAGVGRTGTLILCDICLRQAAVTGSVNVLHEFKKLRESRTNLVNNERQYIFAHVVLVEYLTMYRTEIPCNNHLPLTIEELKKQVPFHLQRLRNTEWQDQALHHPLMSSTPRLPRAEHLAKNRFPELAPDPSALIYLTRYPIHDPDKDYINAVVVDGFTVKSQFLASQLPMPSTLPDLWRLIAEQQIKCVIVLQKPEPLDPTCCEIIPGEKLVDGVPFINVEIISKTVGDANFEIDELLLTNTSEAEISTQNVTVITCLGWGLGKDGKPPPPEVLVSLWLRSQKVRIREQGPTLVLCLDGVTGCGLYLALSFLLERMAVERECDIILAARAVRRSRQNFLQSEEQIEYLYNAAATYITTFEMYANFD